MRTKKEKNPYTLTLKESRAIIKNNLREMKKFEKAKRRKVTTDYFTSELKNPDNVLEVENLHTYFFTDSGVSKAVNGISFDVPKDSIVGLVGESGCGKSVTSLSIMQLVQAPQGQVVDGAIRFSTKDFVLDENGKKIPVYEKDENGEVLYAEKLDKRNKLVLDKDGHTVLEPVQARSEDGVPLFEMEERHYDIAKMPTEDMCRIRGKDISMIFQEPMTSLNPVFTVGYQIEEVVYLINPLATKDEAREKAIEMLSLVGIPMPETIIDYYPHQLSGGMRQRVMIAIALVGNPKLIIADEPTTALDVTIQSQILQLIKTVQKRSGASVLLITHDLGVVAETCDYVVVMYAGKIVEKGTVFEIFDNPMHPYTKGIQKAKPTLDTGGDSELYSIPGSVPNPINMPNECLFKGRCDCRCSACEGEYPQEIKITDTHSVFCHLYKK
ncbi:MAG: ABC transporter ATP-binding protein [Corallococcus sp.]|nr:ABC transporter ATP-binding protein [Corallococcus sp.]MCM1359573.1 ABC transporter ATP-binding protein [Corallococcus sp.]MCM1395165.1 ABC transporter ATP-binding protein [Corallococcus sp.]